jgi:5-methyltetrahydrofolate--homocysteine methyltransferase
MTDFEEMINALIEGNKSTVISLTQTALDQAASASDILKNGLMAGMEIVGEKMEAEEMFIPEVLRSAKVMSAAIDILKPLLLEKELSATGKLVIGTVKGDLHDIGKNLVCMMFESAGFDVYDLGADVPPERFAQEVKEKRPDILGLSALLTTTMPMMKTTIEALNGSGLRKQVKVIVGGAPVSQDFADQIGANGYAHDAGSAVKLAKTLVNKK